MEPGGRELQLEEQALRWDLWEQSNAEREQRLVRDLTYEFSRMLRHRLDRLRRPKAGEAPLAGYLEKIRVFISHLEHDDDGEPVARSIRDWLHAHSALSSFFDIYDIPAGLSFREVLLHPIETSAVVGTPIRPASGAVERSLSHVPMIVVDCLRNADQRSIPYMGNVPIIRVSPEQQDRVGAVIECLLDEVFRDLMWRCRTERYRETSPRRAVHGPATRTDLAGNAPGSPE